MSFTTYNERVTLCCTQLATLKKEFPDTTEPVLREVVKNTYPELFDDKLVESFIFSLCNDCRVMPVQNISLVEYKTIGGVLLKEYIFDCDLMRTGEVIIWLTMRFEVGLIIRNFDEKKIIVHIRKIK